jgi:hypothetical protein
MLAFLTLYLLQMQLRKLGRNEKYKSFHHIVDISPVRTVSFHPCPLDSRWKVFFCVTTNCFMNQMMPSDVL